MRRGGAVESELEMVIKVLSRLLASRFCGFGAVGWLNH